MTFSESDSFEDSDPSEVLPDHTVEVKDQIIKLGQPKGEKKLLRVKNEETEKAALIRGKHICFFYGFRMTKLVKSVCIS